MKKIIFTVLISMAGMVNAQLSPIPTYCDNRVRPCVIMNDTGSYFGQLMNTAANTWGLGYAAQATGKSINGTSALTWNTSGVVTIPGSLSVTGAITGASISGTVAAASVAAGSLGSGVIVSSYALSAPLTAASAVIGGTVTSAAVNISGSGQLLLGNASSTALISLVPGQAKGALILNSTTGNLCMSTSTVVGSWVIVSTPTLACY